MLYTSNREQPTQNMINTRKLHTIQIHKQTDEKDHTQITTSKHNQINFLKVTLNTKLERLIKDMTEPNYAAVVQKKHNLTTVTPFK